MTYVALFRAMCGLNIPYSWNIQVDTWMHEADANTGTDASCTS